MSKFSDQKMMAFFLELILDPWWQENGLILILLFLGILSWNSNPGHLWTLKTFSFLELESRAHFLELNLDPWWQGKIQVQGVYLDSPPPHNRIRRDDNPLTVKSKHHKYPNPPVSNPTVSKPQIPTNMHEHHRITKPALIQRHLERQSKPPISFLIFLSIFP